MREFFILIAHLFATLAKLSRPHGLGAVAAESVALRHQLLIMKRRRHRAPTLTSWDRLVLASCTLFALPKRLQKMALVVKPATLLRFHRAMVKRKYRLLYSPKKCGRRGPRGPSKELVDAIVEMKQRNSRFGCRKIAEQISSAFGVALNKDVVRRILVRCYRPVSGGDGPSWLTIIGHAKDSLWSVDLFRCESILLKSYWIMVVMDVFTRRRFRREYLDRTLFWNQGDLERNLENYKIYYNKHRCHTGLTGITPAQKGGAPPHPVAKLKSYRWRQHCHGLFQTPIAA